MIILGRDSGLTVAVDEQGPWLVILEYDPQANNDALKARIMLPPQGIQIIEWAAAPENLAGNVAEMPARPEQPQRPAWRRTG